MGLWGDRLRGRPMWRGARGLGVIAATGGVGGRLVRGWVWVRGGGGGLGRGRFHGRGGGKPVFLAVNKMDTDAMLAGAENFRRLGFRNVLPISAEHGSGIGDLLDAVFEVLPESSGTRYEVQGTGDLDAVMLTAADEMGEDEDGPDFAPIASEIPMLVPKVPAGPVRRLRSHGEYESRE